MISVAAELAGVHPQTLRIYERKGLIEPDARPVGSRRYSRARHRAAAPDPGAHERRVSALPGCPADARARGSSSRRSAAPASSPGRESDDRIEVEARIGRNRAYRTPRSAPLVPGVTSCAVNRTVVTRSTSVGDRAWHSIPNKFTRKTHEASAAPRSRWPASRNHTEVAPEHLLAALLDQPEGVVLRCSSAIGVAPKPLRDKVDDELAKLPAGQRRDRRTPRSRREAFRLLEAADKERESSTTTTSRPSTCCSP